MKGEDFKRSPNFNLKIESEECGNYESAQQVPNSFSLNIEDLLNKILTFPFNLEWSKDLIEDFLIKCDYKITTKTKDGLEYKVAYKSKEELDNAESDNVLFNFQLEVQQILINWLLKIRQD